ncbi:MAG: di-heme oxidoredictase family protein [Nannocystaceae bacterium]
MRRVHLHPGARGGALLCAGALALAGCGEPELEPLPGEELAGGDTTIFDVTEDAYSFAARNMSFERRQRFVVGNSFFNKNWVAAPASTDGRDGLGPTFNARSCSTCHLRDGRGRPPAEGEAFVGLLLRLSVPGVGPHGEPLPVPGYGDQLQPYALDGVPEEAAPHLEYVEESGTYADGAAYSLRRPIYTITAPAFGPLAEDLQVSPRVAPAMIGLGLLEAIPAASLVAAEDPEDADGDGISGRVNWVWDVDAAAPAIGRFGWKANQPSVRQQTAGAFLGDLGVTSSLFPQENCPEGQVECAASPSGGAPELSDDLLDDIAFYSETLAVPARRDVDAPEVLAGRELFRVLACDACHTPAQRTAADAALEEARDQQIWPYTDLLLHDMGEGLADGRPDFLADGDEWRTPPLWGLGLLEAVNGHTELLHDGRARSIEEAILWHGGEAAPAKAAFADLDADDRAALLRFLESL